MDVSNEPRIGKLKQLALQLGIPNISKYRLQDIETLRELILEKLHGNGSDESESENESDESDGSESDNENKIDNKSMSILNKFTQLEQSIPKITSNDFNERFKLSKVSEGTYGKVFRGKYKDEDAVFKLTNLNENLGLQGFLWECLITEAAHQCGVGPRVIGKAIVPDKNFGVLVLQEYQQSTSPVPPEKMYYLLSKLHRHGICHRDLGVRNILQSGNVIVIIDFGLSFYFSGKVPEEYQLFDHIIYGIDNPEYLRFLRKKYSKKEIDRYLTPEGRGNDYTLESLTVKHFPEEMLRVLPLKNASNYLHNVEGDNAVILDRYLAKRKGKLG